MIKKLVKHGNSHALVIEKPIQELLGITPDTPLTITTDGKRLIISSSEGEERKKAFREALEKGNKKFGRALQRLAE